VGGKSYLSKGRSLTKRRVRSDLVRGESQLSEKMKPYYVGGEGYLSIG
jgi:hypothetical protein